MDKGRIGFIGSGNMATALIKGLLESKLYRADQIGASDVDNETLGKKSRELGTRAYISNIDLVRDCPIIVLSVKPQIIKEVLGEIGHELKGDQLIISIAAGTPLNLIKGMIEKDLPLIRVMPNTPALIQKGMSALAPGEFAAQEHMDIAGRIFSAVGETVVVSEEMMDAVTALSGSGPGFVFRIMESFTAAGETVGFDGETSLKLVLQTFIGSVNLALESEKTLSELREMVTSPGGTTAAGLAVFEEMDLDGLIKSVLAAARDRSVELGK